MIICSVLRQGQHTQTTARKHLACYSVHTVPHKIPVRYTCRHPCGAQPCNSEGSDLKTCNAKACAHHRAQHVIVVLAKWVRAHLRMSSLSGQLQTQPRPLTKLPIVNAFASEASFNKSCGNVFAPFS